jgi:hypothetical protein
MPIMDAIDDEVVIIDPITTEEVVSVEEADLEAASPFDRYKQLKKSGCCYNLRKKLKK